MSARLIGVLIFGLMLAAVLSEAQPQQRTGILVGYGETREEACADASMDAERVRKLMSCPAERWMVGECECREPDDPDGWWECELRYSCSEAAGQRGEPSRCSSRGTSWPAGR